jgi:DNA-binding transcriptional LysR family regulator
LRLTPVGALLAGHANQSLTDLVSVCSEIKGTPRRRRISIISPATFGMHWLMQRIESYEAIEKDVEVWLTTRMANERIDFFASDLVVTRGIVAERQANLVKQTILFDEILTVIASSNFLKRWPISSPKDIVAYSRVAALTRPSDWAYWLELAKIEDNPASLKHRFDHQFIAMHAVREGIGSMVAPSNLFSHDFAFPFPELVFRGLPYCVYHGSAVPKYLRRFLDWLIEEARHVNALAPRSHGRQS